MVQIGIQTQNIVDDINPAEGFALLAEEIGRAHV